MTTVQSNDTLDLGRVYVTRAVLEKITESEIWAGIASHVHRDWSDECAEDRLSNDEGVEHGHRLLSVYRTREGDQFWIITEWDCSETTVLLPEEY